MKTKYEEMMNEMELKEDPKEFVKDAVLNYKEKPSKKHFALKTGFVVACVALLLVIPGFIIQNQKNSFSFVIKADESLYQVAKGELILQDVDLKQELAVTAAIYPDADEKSSKVIRYYSTLPFSIYVEGDNIDSITYHLDHGVFVKLKEIYDSSEAVIPEISENSTRLSIPKNAKSLFHLLNKGFDVEGDPKKTQWELIETGVEIKIPYELQRTMDALYAVNPIVYYSDLSVEEKALLKNDSNEFSEELSEDPHSTEKMIDALNLMSVDVCVNYKDGTSESTNIKFRVDEKTFKLNFDKEDK